MLDLCKINAVTVTTPRGTYISRYNLPVTDCWVHGHFFHRHLQHDTTRTMTNASTTATPTVTSRQEVSSVW